MRKGRVAHLDQRDAVLRKFVSASLVVQRPLLATGDAAGRRLRVPEWDALKVLPLAILDHEAKVGIISVAGELPPGIATEEVEGVLTRRSALEHLVAQVDDVGFVLQHAR